MTAVLTRIQVRAVDRIAMDRYKMTGLVLMENAGRNCASLVDQAFGPSATASIFCGTGNNGGDGFVIARHLANRGWTVRCVVVGEETRMTPDTKSNFSIAVAMHIDTSFATDEATHRDAVARIRPADIVVDALLGTGFTGEVRAGAATLIRLINSAPKRAVVAVDVPSGLDCDTGAPSNATMRANMTVTFVARKAGFDESAATPFVGKIEVADIGVPGAIVEEVRKTIS